MDLPPRERPLPARVLALRPSLYAALIAAAAGIPLLIWVQGLPIAGNTYGKPFEHFELLGFTGSAALFVFAVVELRRRGPLSLETALPVIAPALLGVLFLQLVSEYPARSWDYGCYEQAAQLVEAGGNPYGGCYIYPPLPAQAMSALYGLVGWAGSLTQVDIQPQTRWDLVYYAYQCVQILLVLFTYAVCYRFARSLGLNAVHASLLVSALFVFNNPLFRTVRYHQMNLWVLDAFVLSALLLKRYPGVVALAVAVAAHVKLYPAILLAPWAAARQWRVAAGSLVGIAVIGFLQTGGGRDWTLWSQFLSAFRSFTETMSVQVTDLRNVGVRGVVYQSGQLTERLLGLDPGALTSYVDPAVALVTVGIAVWFAVRFLQRERIYRRLAGRPAAELDGGRLEQFRWYGHTMDAAGLSLLVSPLVWEHHFVVAVPLILWAVAIRGREQAVPIGVAAFLILVMPTFGLYPLVYHRLAGLLLLLRLTEPAAVAASWLPDADRTPEVAQETARAHRV
jgi:hypothetical protein